MTTTGEATAGIAALRALVAQVESLPRGELLGLQRSVVEVRREADVLLARVAAEIARRSEPAPGAVGLSRREGFQSPQALVASVSGGTTGEAGRLARVGKVMADAARAEADGRSGGTDSPTADPQAPHSPGAPATPTPAPVFPVLAAALSVGRLSVEAGAVLAGALERVADVLDAPALTDWESHVVDKAIGLPLLQVRRMVSFAEARITPQALKEREEHAFHERFATMRPQPDGSMLLTARLDPVSAAPVRAMIDGYVRQAFQARRDAAPSPENTAPSAAQLRADALAWLARHATGCEDSHAGIKTTVVVRLSLEDLQAGDGVAEIDGTHTPISISAARQLAADAGMIPTVLGGDSEILDWGRTRRLFTRAQRLALIERDAGCAKCHAPPDWCDAHHIAWWGKDNGRTDLANGVMLCVRCHHDIHQHGWNIHAQDAQIWITPPPHVDPTRTPTLGGRTRIDVAT
ncbi:DUF222 domain-containing protein [Demequina zhanjiangensis]|uniref:DUF222 domain-containing protein n=1 Tax=Demequina zhanjiangensis TaxID=3051659 RepID=A0ABT8FYL9_9MICO|nr:DUF222 domain-containing protein [Demequina sp. SYSU T00b26]MDN4471804.1 DUF222 domain-containing protein [Demequina sp. SYSU T00b26]